MLEKNAGKQMLHVIFETDKLVLERKLLEAGATNVQQFTHSLT